MQKLLIIIFLLFLTGFYVSAQTQKLLDKETILIEYRFDSGYNHIQDSFSCVEFNSMILKAVVYDKQLRTIKKEFLRIDSCNYYCTEFDSIGEIIDQGNALLESKPYAKDSVLLFDNMGNIKSHRQFSYYKFIKNGEWNENNIHNWSSGNYINNKKEGKWQLFKRGYLEDEINYKNGIIISTKKINIVESGTEKEKYKLLCRKWYKVQLINNGLVYSTTPLNYTDDFINLKDDNTFSSPAIGFDDRINDEKGKWNLTNAGTKIFLKSNSRKQVAVINYLSENSLIITFEPYMDGF